MSKTISMINWKGGVGKTTLTLHIAAGLCELDKKVLVIDLDPQCNMSFLAVGLNNYIRAVYKEGIKTLKSLFDSYFGNTQVDHTIINKGIVNANPTQIYTELDIIFSHQDLVLLDMQLARHRKAGHNHKEETKFEIEKIAILHNMLRDIRDNYDYILIDCPPNVNFVTQNAFYTSDYYIVPAIPDFLSTTGISLIRDFMDKFNKDFTNMQNYAEIDEQYIETKFAGIIFNMVDEYGGSPKATHKETIQSMIRQQKNVFSNYLTDGDGISVAASQNYPVYAYDALPRANSNAKKQSEYLMKIVQEFISKIV